MVVVLVHGSPEVSLIWDPLVESLGALRHPEPIRLSPPGFGAESGPEWTSTVQEYRDWLITELTRISDLGFGPIDLVGHDWGGGHTVNAVALRPDLVRSWCSDSIGLFDPDYLWHERALRVQDPLEGDIWLKDLLHRTTAERAAEHVSRGMAPAIAQRIAAAMNDNMTLNMLRLYRDAAQPTMRDLGHHLEACALRPGLVIVAGQDGVVGTHEQRRRTATRAGAQIAEFPDLGHWWMTQDPDAGAEVLSHFWASLP
ncbi:alpha/beta hydrolase [Arthrobacter sp. MI7-26]|uniref:alpha/beta fold hydrolase n=1 Tax=Arthrobacter sp. MI7-26 TaxID=2993653 RepID=UPI002248C604|nr:alpha/beta hydrolase [Arthrobacter sp. MI7-26]MCX2748053.1 alpha/beta hydrolase [Arthrobacter sp. MI7-26]